LPPLVLQLMHDLMLLMHGLLLVMYGRGCALHPI
jgi:hypothetical protein